MQRKRNSSWTERGRELGVNRATLETVLSSWGPGKFDAEIFLDGKAFNPRQETDGVVTGTNVPGATLIPNAYGLAGFNQHTWRGAWGTVTYWNAFVAVLEMHGKGTPLRLPREAGERRADQRAPSVDGT